jgi:hypothetical protein
MTGNRAMHRERVEVLPTKFSLGCGAVRGNSLSQDGDTPVLQPCYLGNISLIIGGEED